MYNLLEKIESNHYWDIYIILIIIEFIGECNLTFESVTINDQILRYPKILD